MTHLRFVRCIVGSAFALALFASGCSYAFADAVSVQIQSVFPAGAVEPGTPVSFIASSNGFIDPSYAASDSFSASGATTGTIDKTGGAFSWTPGVYDAGRHSITVTATDAYGHAASASVTILVASDTLVIGTLSPGPVVAAGTPLSFTVSAPGFTAPAYAAYDSYAMSTLSSANINSSGTFLWSPTRDELGAHAIAVRAYDQYGHDARAVVNVTVINPSVSLLSLKPGPAPVGSTVSFSATSTSLAQPVYSASDSFSGTSTVTASAMAPSGAFSWTPSASDIGSHTLVVTGTDAYGNAASTTATIVVTAAPAGAPAAPAAAPTAAAPVAPAAPAPAANTAAYRFTTALSVGSRGSAVTELQTRLTELGFYAGPITGYFGPLTAGGVRKFQSAHGISPIGLVGPATRAALNGG